MEYYIIMTTIITYKKGGISFGVQKAFVCDEEGKGVIPVEYHKKDSQTLVQKAMKYPEPKLADLPKKPKLTEEMKDILIEHMDIDIMDDELIDACAVDMWVVR